MTAPTTTGAYSLDNAWEHARDRLATLERMYDPPTIRRLQAVGVGPGWQCLELGAGGGSIARWLCAQVGETGRVRAVDLDTRFVEEIEAANLEVACLDLTKEDLPREAYDLVHARCLLVHLAPRERVLDGLVASLRPGGWLVLEEPDNYATAALGSGLHAEVLGKVNAGAESAGVNLTWARNLPGLLHERGLRDIEAESVVPLVEGSSPGSDCLRLSGIQLREQAIAVGATPEQLEEWYALLRTPGQWFAGWAMVAAWGRRP